MKMTTPQKSSEQMAIVDAIREGLNVRVIAVPGSGKTTTVVLLASELCPRSRVLMITYNRELMLETRAKVSEIRRADIHTIHSFIGTHYDIKCTSFSSLITNFINEQGSLRQGGDHPQYDVVIIDEAQDLNHRRVAAIHRILRDCSILDARLLIMGDPHQCIYEWQGASSRYLVDPEEHFTPRTFVDRPLSVSYRLTREVAEFASTMVQGTSSMIRTTRSGPRIVRTSCWDVNAIYRMIKDFLNQGYRYDDIFVLSHSLKPSKSSNATPVHHLENKLVHEGIPVLRPICGDDTSVLRTDDMTNRLVISSFAASKGRERKIVFVMSWTSKYFVLTNQQAKCVRREVNPYTIPSSVYVAITRAKERLILCESDEAPPWESQVFVRYDLGRMNRVSVSQCIQGNDPKDEDLEGMVDSCFRESGILGESLEIQSHVRDVFGRPSYISDITGTVMGIAIEMFFFKQSSPTIYFGGETISSQPTPPLLLPTPGDLVEMALRFEALQSRFNNRHIQIKNRNWISQHMIDTCVNNFGLHFKGPIIGCERFEVPVEARISKTTTIVGRMDCITKDSVWEFKCVKHLSMIHKLQLLMYEWICKNLNQTYTKHQFKLINLKTGQVLTSKGNKEHIDHIMNIMTKQFVV